MFSCEEDMQAVLDLMWTHLLPAFGPARIESGEADRALAEKLATLSLPTAAQRLGGDRVLPMQGQFQPGPSNPNSHRSITLVDAVGSRMTVREGNTEFTVSLNPEWTTDPGSAMSTSATQLPNGRIAVDLVFLACPHRLEITLDPSTKTFESNWPIMPLFVAGLSSSLAKIQAPA